MATSNADASTSADSGGGGGSSGFCAHNPMPHVLSEGENAAPLEVIGATSTATDKLVIIMVGLPATGKTHIAKRICRYLTFFHDIPSQIFNVGDYRRELCGSQQPASFYDHSNAEALAQRNMACNAALTDMIEYIKQDGVRMAVYDATNSTRERRRHLIKTLNDAGVGAKKIFVESMCDDEALLEQNIKTVKLSTPDYKGVDPKEALKDFHERRNEYMKVYEALEDEDGSYLKILNCRKFVVHNVRGHLPLKVVHFIMNLHTLPRTFYLTRHGQSEYNLLGKIGGDSGLSKAGLEYAHRLAKFAAEEIAQCTVKDPETGEESQEARPCRLWTSTLRRTKETAQFIEHDEFEHTFDNGEKLSWVQFRPMARRNLDELFAGSCDGMTYKEIEREFPDEFKRRQADKLAYRYPRGESYMDVTLRLEPLAKEMERSREPILIVGHQGILRILYAYYTGLDRDEAPFVSIPLNHVIRLTPHAYGCHEERICLLSKEEMLKDGQDEPVTSMPMKEKADGLKYSGNKGAAIRKWSVSGKDLKPYAENDPVMNAPSC
eukprot:CAMPEP_0183291858 /NCGR_PEP_ID=MMETSP0160_2-20130417/1128_1 /TAXON_ID=2839 ORGANISM="Odontella Sinensis, Strain Grunow 1884" /NCGR_SAMPLE_ID=MMETSP0160_2 /ASSEMBLY_ACC=CAM_ASM_000250 /LENGTH=548 /DNA_ID=CAMNT_0025452717 /DNA_START=127 /DNA_END=1773 /DNA_ORIENTATION=-